MTKLKKRILKLGIFALMPVLALLFCLNNTYAWYVEDDQVTSENKYNKNANMAENKLIAHEDGNTLYNFSGYYVSEYISVQPNLYYSCNNWNSYYCWWYDVNKNPVSVLPSNVTTAQAPSNAYFLRISSNDIEDLMLNAGTSVLPYEPYGKTYVNADTFDYMTYLIGNNYFSSGRAVIYQTSDNNWYDQHIYPTNQTCNYVIGSDNINKYIDGNTLNMALLINDLVAGLKTQTNYTSGRFTQISIKPALNIGGTATYPPVLGKYIVTEFYCPGYNLPCRTWSGSTVELFEEGNYSMNWTKEGDNYYIGANGDPNFDDNYLWDICFKLQYDSSAQTYYGPSLVTCHTEDVPTLNNYELGVKSGKEIGYALGKQAGDAEGFARGRTVGYNIGLSDGARQNLQTNGMKTLFETILSYPVNLVKNTLDFNFMGVNIAGVIMFIVSCGIVIFVLKRFL